MLIGALALDGTDVAALIAAQRFYHVICRGNRHDPLIRNYSDFHAFFHILEQLHEKNPLEMASYC